MTDLSKLTTEDICTMLEVAFDGKPSWPTDEFAEILCAQLDAPFLEDFAELSESSLSKSAEFLTIRANPQVQTLRQLLNASRPSKQLLFLAKDFAKALSANSDFPRDLAKVIYYAILAAAHRHQITISQFDDSDLIHGISWALDQTWIDPEVRALLCEFTPHH